MYKFENSLLRGLGVHRIGLLYASALIFFVTAVATNERVLSANQAPGGAMVKGCPNQAHDASALESSAEDDYAVANYQQGEAKYRAAAKLYYRCAIDGPTPKARDWATYYYLHALVAASKHASGWLEILKKVKNVASEFKRSTNDVEVAAKVAGLKSYADDRIASAARKPMAATAATPTGQPAASESPATFNVAGCRNGIANFDSAYDAWRGAVNRYLQAGQKTTASQPISAPPGPAWVGAASYAG